MFRPATSLNILGIKNRVAAAEYLFEASQAQAAKEVLVKLANDILKEAENAGT